MTRLGSVWPVIAIVLGLAACARDTQQPTPEQTGSSHVLLTDGPFPYFRLARVDLYIVNVSASLSADTGAGAGGFVTLVTPNRRFDVLALQNGATAELGSLNLPTGAITALRMVIDTDSSSITLRDGRVLTGANNGIHWQSSAGRPTLNALIHEQLIGVPDTGAVIVIDFDLGRAFTSPQIQDSVSADSSFTFMPQFRAVDATRTGTITGVVRAHSADGAPVARATVQLYLGYPGTPENTWPGMASGMTDSTGTFRISYVTRSSWWASTAWVGATYIVAVDPPSGAGLGRALVPNLTVQAGQVTSAGVVVLP